MDDKKKIFQAKDVFLPDPDNKDSTILKIPQEYLDDTDWTEGDTIKVSIGDQGTIMLEKVEKSLDK